MTTISDSFERRLPVVRMRVPEDGGPREIPSIDPFGSTGVFDAPKALEEVHPSTYCDAAAAVLPRIQFRLNTQLPAVEHSIYLRTEGDVIRAVNLYLVHPVNMALQAIRSSVFCRSEWQHGSTARTDLIWEWTNKDKRVALGVLELKNTQLLVKEDFDQGLADMRPDTTSWEDPRSLVDRAFSEDLQDNSFLGPSASRVSRQAMKYHDTTKTDFVAVFDWSSMIIFDFGGMDEGIYKLAKGTWHQEGPDLPPYATFRMLLLGMLITSMRRTGVL